jgi:hypothetical protein
MRMDAGHRLSTSAILTTVLHADSPEEKPMPAARRRGLAVTALVAGLAVVGLPSAGAATVSAVVGSGAAAVGTVGLSAIPVGDGQAAAPRLKFDNVEVPNPFVRSN